MVLQQNLKINREAIAEFCRRNHIRRLSLFGSVLTDRFRPDSDVDVLVEFEEDARIGYMGLGRLERELTDSIGRVVDLHTPNGISRYIREKVRASSSPIYGD